MLDLGGPRPKHRVVGLLDDAGTLRYITADRADKPAQWRAIWRYRNQLESECARWLRTLAAEPREVVLLGSVVGLHAPVARAVAKMLSDLCNTIKGGRKGQRRRVARVEPDGTLTIWESQAAAARALGTSPPSSKGPDCGRRTARRRARLDDSVNDTMF